MRTLRKKTITLACLVVAAGLLLNLPFPGIVAAEDSVTLAPSKIVLNAQGSWEYVQAVIRVPLAPGYRVEDFNAELYFGDDFIVGTDIFYYCYLDSNFIASFDREEIQSVCRGLGIEGEYVATVKGYFTACPEEGECYTRTFEGRDLVEILAPGDMGIR